MLLQRRQALGYLCIVILLTTILLCYTSEQPTYYEEEEILVDEPSQSLAPRKYLFPPPVCDPVSFVVIVHIRVEEFNRRNEWRYSYRTFMNTFNFTLFFAVGIPKNYSLYPMLKEESEKYKDLIVADYIDDYKNMTLKHLSQLRYFHEKCTKTKFLVKLDDDVAVNIVVLFNFISSIHNGPAPWFSIDLSYGPKIWCRIWKNTVVRRSSKLKWAVPRSRWQKHTWPDYCAGLGYIATQPAIARLLRATEQESWLWVDDVFITGILAEKGQVQLVSANNYYSLKEDDASPFVRDNAIFALTWRNETWNIFDMVN